MDENPMSCRPLSISHFNGNVAMSTFNTSIGAVVRFACPADQDMLFGDPVLQCSRAGKWNGTVPQCINADSQNFTTTTAGIGSYQNISTSSHVTSTTEVTDASTSEPGIDTIVLVLWAVGGAMLITLIVLLACILQSHKKARRERSALARARRASRHGGVNPSFSAYDEIWQWIPVVRDAHDQCESRGHSPTEQNSSNAERNLLSTLRLPSYNEAVRQNSQQRGSEGRVSSNPDPSRTNNNQNGRQNSASISIIQMETENHYETIPFDTQRQTNARVYQNRTQQVDHLSSISVRSPTSPYRSASQPANCNQSRGMQQRNDRSHGNSRDSSHVGRRSQYHDTLQVRPITQQERRADTRNHDYRLPLTGLPHSQEVHFPQHRARMCEMNEVTHNARRDEFPRVTSSITRLPRVVPTAR